jgi:hypothetical protein
MASARSKISTPIRPVLSNIDRASGGSIAGFPITWTLNAFCKRTAPSGSPFSSTRASILALLECNSMRPESAGGVTFEPGLTRKNLPKGFDRKDRSLMFAMTSPHASMICAV